jgi:signal transduction histidine kinase
MWRRLSLRTRILVALALLVSITVGGGLMSMINSYIMDRTFSSVIESDLEAMQAAQELENALVMQKGYVTYYFQDGDEAWLKELEKYHLAFESWLRKARQWTANDEERRLLRDVYAQYAMYCDTRDEVIRLYKEGRKEEGFRLHQDLRTQFNGIAATCRLFKEAFVQSIAAARQRLSDRVGLSNAATLFGLCLAITFASILAYILLKEVLGPIRELAAAAYNKKVEIEEENEVKVLSLRFQDLIEDVDQTKTKLERSREHLAQAEKWALVGKLAAGVAHSVRNPLTSVKMRLFSMERDLALTASQKEDFEVIAEEIRHIDTIVGNFLEFSRPPRLRMQAIRPSDLVDAALRLMKHRLESYDVKVEVLRQERLPETRGDPDQLKEVIVNLIANACEALVDGGVITITEKSYALEDDGSRICIEVADDGPGVPQEIRDRVFQPFFSTKEEGTGLGLSIAARIVEEHGGSLHLDSPTGQGARFVITLPIRGIDQWAKSS